MAIPKMILRYSIIKTLAPFSIIFVELQPHFCLGMRKWLFVSAARRGRPA